MRLAPPRPPAAPAAAPASAAATADRDQLLPLAVDGDFELMRLARGARHVDLDDVLAVQRESSCESPSPPRVPNGSSSTRASCGCSGGRR